MCIAKQGGRKSLGKYSKAKKTAKTPERRQLRTRATEGVNERRPSRRRLLNGKCYLVRQIASALLALDSHNTDTQDVLSLPDRTPDSTQAQGPATAPASSTLLPGFPRLHRNWSLPPHTLSNHLSTTSPLPGTILGIILLATHPSEHCLSILHITVRRIFLNHKSGVLLSYHKLFLCPWDKV